MDIPAPCVPATVFTRKTLSSIAQRFRQVPPMSHSTQRDANRSQKDTGKEVADKKETHQQDANEDARAAAFMKQVKSKDVPSGLRPDLAPPGPDGEGGDGGGVGSSI